MSNDPILFREDQRFRSHWLMLFIGAGCLFALVSASYLLIVQVFLGHPLGNRPMSNGAAVAVALLEIALAIGLVALFRSAVLQVEVTTRGLFLRFRPFHRKTRQIDLNDVTAIEAVTYRPLRDYGGWGIRRGAKSRCYNVSGEEGVRILYANGYHVLIGSEHAPELAAALHKIWTPPAGANQDEASA